MRQLLPEIIGKERQQQKNSECGKQVLVSFQKLLARSIRNILNNSQTLLLGFQCLKLILDSKLNKLNIAVIVYDYRYNFNGCLVVIGLLNDFGRIWLAQESLLAIGHRGKLDWFPTIWFLSVSLCFDRIEECEPSCCVNQVNQRQFDFERHSNLVKLVSGEIPRLLVSKLNHFLCGSLLMALWHTVINQKHYFNCYFLTANSIYDLTSDTSCQTLRYFDTRRIPSHIMIRKNFLLVLVLSKRVQFLRDSASKYFGTNANAQKFFLLKLATHQLPMSVVKR